MILFPVIRQLVSSKVANVRLILRDIVSISDPVDSSNFKNKNKLIINFNIHLFVTLEAVKSLKEMDGEQVEQRAVSLKSKNEF